MYLGAEDDIAILLEDYPSGIVLTMVKLDRCYTLTTYVAYEGPSHRHFFANFSEIFSISSP